MEKRKDCDVSDHVIVYTWIESVVPRWPLIKVVTNISLVLTAFIGHIGQRGKARTGLAQVPCEVVYTEQITTLGKFPY